jgi:uncharacterized protein (DUF779 family)
MEADRAPRIVATDAAIAEIGRLRDEHGPLMFFQSGGCCDGSSPMCFSNGELLLGPNDLLLGDVDGCSFHIDTAQYERWNSPALVLDVAAGSGSSMSLEEAHGVHFVLSPPSAAPENRAASSEATANSRPASARGATLVGTTHPEQGMSAGVRTPRSASART